MFFIKPSNWADFAPFGFGAIYGGQAGIMAGKLLSCSLPFLALNPISLAIDEVKHLKRIVPKGIVLSLFIVTILYIIVTLVLTGMVHYSKLNVADAVFLLLCERLVLGWAQAIFLLWPF